MARFWLLAVLAVGAVATKVTPMDKVISLIEKLEAQVTAEGKKEAEAYDEFACFCKDQLVEKMHDIDNLNASHEKETLHESESSATMDDETLNVDSETGKKNEAETNIETETQSMNEAFDTAEGHIKALKRGIAALKGAIDMLQAGRDAGVGTGPLKQNVFAQLPPIVLAELEKNPKRTSATSVGPILDLLKNLLNTFEADHNTAVSDQRTSRQASLDVITMQEHALENANEFLTTARENLAEATQHNMEAEKALTELNGDLGRQNAFKDDLKTQCGAKAVQWDKRSKMKSDELQALGQALHILKERAAGVAGSITNTRGGFLAKKVSKVSKHHDAMIEETMPEVDELVALENFVQLKATTTSPVQEAIQFLSRQAHSMGGSTALSTLVLKATADPFRAVRKMITKLITDLKAQKDEAQKNADSCETNMKDAQSQIDTNTADVSTQKGEIADSNTKIKEATATRDDAAAVRKEALANRKKATQLHNDFQKQSASTKADAKVGIDSVSSALQILQEFYSADASLLQDNPLDKGNWNANADKDGNVINSDASTGFDNADGRSQDEAKGIVGILEVLLSDFQRTHDEMEHAMEEENTEFEGMDEEYSNLISTSENTITEQEGEIADQNVRLSDAKTQLKTSEDLLKTSEELLSTWEKECVQGESYEVRMQKRENEIASLKQALEILDGADVNMTRKGQSLD